MADKEALRLADALDARVVPRWVHGTGQTPKQSGYKKDAECEQAAACLRRQHAEIESLKAERDEDRRREYGYSQQVVDALTNERDALRAERDVLRAALEEVVRVFDSAPSSISDTVWVTGDAPETLYDRCRAAILGARETPRAAEVLQKPLD